MKIKLTIFILTVLIALSPMSVFAQQESRFYTPTNQERYNYKYGCNVWESCHNALQMHREPAGLLGAIGQYGNMLGVWSDGSTVQNPLTHPNIWCHPNDPNCGQSVEQQQYHQQQYYQRNYQQPSPQGQQQFSPQPQQFQQCQWVTLNTGEQVCAVIQQ